MRIANARARVDGWQVAALILLAGTAITASAETWKGLELERKLRETPWHFGPFRIQPQLVISNAGVDSNVFYSPSEPIKDYTVTAGPAATIYLPIHRKFVLSAYGSPQYVWYSKTDRERTWNYYLNGAAQLSLKNVFFSFEGVYSDARERWNTEIDIRPRRTEEGYGGSALVRLAWKTSFSLGYRTVKYDYASVVYGDNFDVRERLNRQESYANLSFFYQASTQRRFFLDFEYGDYEFEFASQAAIGDSRSGAAYAGLEFSRLGRRSPRAHPGRIQEVRREGRGRAGLSGDRRRFAAFDPAGQAVRHPGVVRPGRPVLALVQQSLLHREPAGRGRVPLSCCGSCGSITIIRSGGTAIPRSAAAARTSSGSTNTRSTPGGVYFRIRKTVALGFIASWWARNSNLDAEDDKRTFFGVNLTYDF